MLQISLAYLLWVRMRYAGGVALERKSEGIQHLCLLDVEGQAAIEEEV